MNQHFEECFLQYLPAGDLHNISKSNMIPQVMPSDSLIAPTQTALSKFRCSQPPNNSYVFIKVKDDLGEVQVRTQSCGLSTSTINHINIGFDHPSQPNSSSAKQRFDHPDQTHPAPMKRPLTSAARRALTGGVGGQLGEPPVDVDMRAGDILALRYEAVNDLVAQQRVELI